MKRGRDPFKWAYQSRGHLNVVGEGFYNKNYLFEINSSKYILRVPKSVEDYDLRTYNEEWALLELEKIGFSLSPRLVHSSFQPRFMVIEFIEPDDARKEPDSGDIFEILAELHSFEPKRAHSLLGSFDRRFREFGLRQIRLYQSILEKHIPGLGACLFEKAVSSAQWGSRSGRIIHGDPARSNFITTSQGDLRVIDFEFAAIGDPFLDYAFFLNRSCFDDSDAFFSLITRIEMRHIDLMKSDLDDLLNMSIFDVVRSVHVVAAKFLDKNKVSYDVVRGELRIKQLLQHLSSLDRARQEVFRNVIHNRK